MKDHPPTEVGPRQPRAAVRTLGVLCSLTFGLWVNSNPAVAADGGQASPPGDASVPSVDPNLASSRNAPPLVETCVAAHRNGQESRQAGKLRESRDSFRVCAETACPRLLQRDCVRWVGEVEFGIPSVVFRVTVGAEPRDDVRIFMDDTLLIDGLKGKAIEIDPGTHRFRFELAGMKPIEREILIGEGDKMRMVDATFAGPEAPIAPAPRPVSSTPAPLPDRAAERTGRSIPTMSYVLAGVGAIAAVNFGYWGLSSRSLKSELEDGCAPYCAQDRIDQVYQRAVIADVSLGVSIASFLGATLFYLLQPATTEAPSQISGRAAVEHRTYPGVGTLAF